MFVWPQQFDLHDCNHLLMFSVIKSHLTMIYPQTVVLMIFLALTPSHCIQGKIQPQQGPWSPHKVPCLPICISSRIYKHTCHAIQAVSHFLFLDSQFSIYAIYILHVPSTIMPSSVFCTVSPSPDPFHQITCTYSEDWVPLFKGPTEPMYVSFLASIQHCILNAAVLLPTDGQARTSNQYQYHHLYSQPSTPIGFTFEDSTDCGLKTFRKRNSKFQKAKTWIYCDPATIYIYLYCIYIACITIYITFTLH